MSIYFAAFSFRLRAPAPLLMRLAAVVAAVTALSGQAEAGVATPYVVFGYNDLGMHCMNSDFSEMMILPPFNTLHAQVIQRGPEPDIITSDITVRFILPTSTMAANKFNFWSYPYATLGGVPAPDTGLAGLKLAGTMSPTGGNDWYALGIPAVPVDDTGRENPYPLALITVTDGPTVVARTQVVVPVSTEMSCHLCHNEGGKTTAADLLGDHDRLHATTLMAQRPVLCADCHADNALGLPGLAGVANLSRAMHGAHAWRTQSYPASQVCYLCHPGVRTQCQRDVHFLNNVMCMDCHGDMTAMADPGRVPWVTEPTCSGTCHNDRPGFEFEQPGTLYRNSVGHSSVRCAACHGSPHAIYPTATGVDNLQSQLLQDHPGRIDSCGVCHLSQPTEAFFHRVTED